MNYVHLDIETIAEMSKEMFFFLLLLLLLRSFKRFVVVHHYTIYCGKLFICLFDVDMAFVTSSSSS